MHISIVDRLQRLLIFFLTLVNDSFTVELFFKWIIFTVILSSPLRWNSLLQVI